MRLLVVRESRGTGLSFDSLINDRLATFRIGLLVDHLHFVTLDLHFLLLFCMLHFHDQPLVLLEVNTIESDQGRDPNAEPGPELPVLQIVLEHGVARVLHQVQVLQIWARSCDLV